MEHRKKRYIAGAVLLATLLFTSCAPATDEPSTWPKFGPVLEGAITRQVGREPPTPGAHLWFSRALEDGESIQVPALTREEQDAFAQLEDYPEQFRQRLGLYGIHLSDDGFAAVLGDIDPLTPAYLALSVTVIHYKGFDLMAIQHQALRGYAGNLYVFEHGRYKGSFEIGDIDLDNCFRELGDRLWFVTSFEYGAISAYGTEVQWRNLVDESLPLEVDYTRYFFTGYLDGMLGLDFWGRREDLTYQEELFLNGRGIPTLRLRWEYHIETEALYVNDSGTKDIAVGVPAEPFHTFWDEPGVAQNLKDQLETYRNEGTDLQKYMAEDLLKGFRGRGIIS